MKVNIMRLGFVKRYLNSGIVSVTYEDLKKMSVKDRSEVINSMATLEKLNQRVKDLKYYNKKMTETWLIGLCGGIAIGLFIATILSILI